ncbi:class I SAM-dependent methyltransferase [Micromonospora cremea]|uniref:Methyltransferase domain-containing protein n=1 Tax=Micromonospora cremea TaxID=709881 RepID=A0A1N5TCZ5_9ACTN|nr:class I SAM-dependent methyltransferase [Micromonospora cremea]SIM45957.1 Methyltransferase domain-containing protein [Micromonospora cremea]
MTTTAFDDHERLQWAGRATAYQDSLAALCAHPAGLLLDAAGVKAGTRLLDVGTGTGTVAALACSRAAQVTAIDAEPSMLMLARRQAPAADVCHAILPDLPFSDDFFDAAVANFVINHVGDPAATLVELQRVVRPGGRVAVTIWPYPPPPAQQLWAQIFDAADVGRPIALPRLTRDKDFSRTRDGLSELLHRTGLDNVGCDTITWIHRTDPEAWWNGPANGIGATGTLMQRQDSSTTERIRDQYEQHITAYRGPDGDLALPTAALLASASVT